MSIELNDNNFYAVLDTFDGDILIDFWAEWCAPCRMLAPTLERLEQDHEITVVKVNVDESPDLARAYQIMSIPTMIYYGENGFTKTVVGIKPRAELEKEFGLDTPAPVV